MDANRAGIPDAAPRSNHFQSARWALGAVAALVAVAMLRLRLHGQAPPTQPLPAYEARAGSASHRIGATPTRGRASSVPAVRPMAHGLDLASGPDRMVLPPAHLVRAWFATCVLGLALAVRCCWRRWRRQQHAEHATGVGAPAHDPGTACLACEVCGIAVAALLLVVCQAVGLARLRNSGGVGGVGDGVRFGVPGPTTRANVDATFASLRWGLRVKCLRDGSITAEYKDRSSDPMLPSWLRVATEGRPTSVLNFLRRLNVPEGTDLLFDFDDAWLVPALARVPVMSLDSVPGTNIVQFAPILSDIPWAATAYAALDSEGDEVLGPGGRGGVHNPASREGWRSRSGVALWRGSATGGAIHFPEWQTSSQRARLVAASLSNPALLDARFTHAGDAATKAVLEKAGAIAFPLPFGEYMARSKYLVDVDGNAWSSRFMGLLASGAVVLKVAAAGGSQSQYEEFFYSMLQDEVHYVAVKKDLSDLVKKIEWLKADDARAHGIARAAVELTRSYLGKEAVQLRHAQAVLDSAAAQMAYTAEATSRDRGVWVVNPTWALARGHALLAWLGAALSLGLLAFAYVRGSASAGP